MESRSYSWRKVIKPISELGSGYHVVAPDQRGFGRTTGWDAKNISSFRMLNLVTDIIALVFRLGYKTVDCLIGHDFGSPVAGYCALIRPDIFRSVVLMSAPFAGPPSFPSANQDPSGLAKKLSQGLAALDPPRKHYVQHYAPPSFKANDDMLQAPQGLPRFLRAFFHMKSADWPGNDPHPLPSWDASVLARLPEYYIMRSDKTMAETVAPHFPLGEPEWLTDSELSVFIDEFTRTTFQGGLNWYQFSITMQPELLAFAQRRITIPAAFISGEKDWGMYQYPGALQTMRDFSCTEMGEDRVYIVKQAGHWVQQEQPEEVVRIISQFLLSV